MRLLFLSGSGELGGAERSLLDMIASLRQAVPATAIGLLAPAEGPLVAHATALGASAAVLPFGPSLERIGEAAQGGRAALAGRLARGLWPIAAYCHRLRASIRSWAPDVVHSHGLKPHLLAAWSHPGSASVVWHLHDYVGRRPASAALLRRSVSRCAGIVANSCSVADDARDALGDDVPIVPVLNAVDLGRFGPEGTCADLDRLSAMPPAPAGTVRVGLLATFGRWKGHTTFLDACARVPRELPVRAYIVGGPIYQTENSQCSLEELRAHAVRAGVADRVAFCGFVPAAESVLRALDVVVHASTDPEPFGLVIAEAMACGRAVIVADAGGARELVTPGVDALTHIPGDATSLAAQIQVLVADASLRARLAVAARRTALERFDRARLATELMPVYRAAAARRSHT